MPRMMARVVCTLCVTIDTLVPTSWLTSVDLPALGAPISATKPECVVGSACSAVSLMRLFPFPDALALKDRRCRRLFGLPLGAAAAGRRLEAESCTLTVKSGSWSGPSRLSIM